MSFNKLLDIAIQRICFDIPLGDIQAHLVEQFGLLPSEAAQIILIELLNIQTK
jgi:hypothetical protein